MKHLIMGTAGHIDHGKTALIKALTGIDCDTHKEEKTRGITINLGFAHLDLPTGDSLGIIDVPGHHDFVHTMVGGATGIDLGLLVVAADSGVMAQTREHLQIMDVLGIRDGLVALTKIDLVEPELIDLAEEEIRQLVRATFLQGCAIVHVSAVTGEGLDLLKNSIGEVAARLEDRPAGEVFRLFPDRIFTVSGFGTVVTGSALGGSLRTGDTAYLLPGAKKLRVRRLERHGREVEQVVAGDRASINLVGLRRENFKRGMVVSDRVLHDTLMVDVELRLFGHSHTFGLWKQVVVHFGTYEQQARVHLIDRDRLAGGETGLAQIHLAEPCVAQYGDRFVIRSTSNDTTLGGGKIIDPSPLHHRRRTTKVIESMAKIAERKLPELIALEIRKHFRPIGHREIADILNTSAGEVRKVVSGHLPQDIVRYVSGDEIYLIPKRENDRLKERCLKSIAAFQRRHPLAQKGRTIEELMGILELAREPACEAMLGLMLEKLEEEGKLKHLAHSWVLADYTTEIELEMRRKITFVADFLRDCGMHTPLMSDLTRAAEERGMEGRDLKEILGYLVTKHQAYLIERNYIHAPMVDRCREMLLRALAEREEGMTVAQFRDLVGGNRRICLLLLGAYDAEGSTKRVGDLRVLTEKGKATIEA